MKRLLLTLSLAIATISSSYSQRIVENINRDWSFNYGWDLVGLREKYDDINLPHTWNQDALSGKKEYYRGSGNYTRQLNIPSNWKGTKKIYLRFGGVGQSAEVYINGKRVGEHKGGYTAFGFDITSYLNYGGANTLWVRASNAQRPDMMPLAGNYNMYGGIYRDVELIVTPKAHISNSNYATNGIRVTTISASESKATLNISAKVEGDVGSTIDLNFIVRDGEGVKIDSLQKSAKIGVDGTALSQIALTINSPRLWNGTKDPHLYSIEVIAKGEQKSKNSATEYDNIREHFGIRTFEVNSDNEFILNGEKYPIRGVVRYSDLPLYGNATHYDDNLRDIALLKEMGATAVRLPSMAQSQEFIEMCDREGIIVWSDLPFTGPGAYREVGYNSSEEFKENGEEQLKELLHQQYNNPSVIFVGLFDEISQRGDDPLFFIKALNDIVSEEGGGRLSTGASNQDGEINFVTDLIGFNLYLGWSEGDPSDMAGWAKSVRAQWPRLKVALSEYGAGGSIYQHDNAPSRPEVGGKWHPEEWQTKLHYEYLRTIENASPFWGTFACSLADWGAAYSKSGDRAGVSDLGLVTFDRATKKDAFYLYKANWNSDESFVYIASRRDRQRTSPKQDIMVISPSDSVTLVINGIELEKRASEGAHTFIFKECLLNTGTNHIVARNEEGYEDEIVIEL